MFDEMFDIVDENDEIIGQASRTHVHEHGLLHRAVHIFIFNEQGHILLQKRSWSKDRFPGRWTSSVSGHVDAGETYLEAALREIQEEIGWQGAVDLNEIGYIPASKETEQEFIRLYTALIEGPFVAAPEEVIALHWKSPKELSEWLASDPDIFTPSFNYLWVIYQSSF